MALIKKVNTDYGIEAGYWKIGMLSIDRSRKEANFTLFLYIKSGDLKPLSEYVVTLFEMENKEDIFNKYFEYKENSKYTDIYEACYRLTMEQIPFFSDAVSDEVNNEGGIQ